MKTLIFEKAEAVTEHEIRQFAEEFMLNGESTINGSCGLLRHGEAEKWKEYVEKVEQNLIADRLQSTVFFSRLSDTGKIAGIVDIRHRLNTEQYHNGHIGLSVVPSERNKGIGKLLVEKGIQFLAELGETENVVITCDEDNIFSKKMIESCGFTFESIFTEPHGNRILIYSIKIRRQ